MVPYVPLVNRKVYSVFAVLLAANAVAVSDDRLYISVKLNALGEEVADIAVAVSEILVKRNIVYLVISQVKDGVFPFAEHTRPAAAAAAQDELDGIVRHPHKLRGFVGDAPVFDGSFMPHLPVAVHLVSEAPVFYAVRLFIAVGYSKVAPVCAARMVAVFDEISRLVGSSCAEIDGHQRLCFGFAAPVYEFVRAEFVCFGGVPREFKALRPVFQGTYAVLPIVSGNEISSGITHDGNVNLFYQVYDVAAKAASVCARMTRLEDAAVNRPT